MVQLPKDLEALMRGEAVVISQIRAIALLEGLKDTRLLSRIRG
jgi:hypothetical protein